MSTVLVVGAGHAGSQFAVSLRTEGFDGEIIILNDDIEVPYHKPPLSKKYLAAEQPSITPLRAASAYTKADVKWLHQSVSQINTSSRSVLLSDNSSFVYDHLVLATGARNRTLPNLASCHNVYSLRTAEDAQRMHQQLGTIKDMAVLGGGFIGLEVAACLAALGKNVTVIEAADRLLGRVVAPEISKRVQGGLTQLGVTVKTRCINSDFNIKPPRLESITFPEGPALSVDAMLVGIGAIPNSELAAEAGIACNNGITVNGCLQTSAADVYAIGDCAEYPHWQTGGNQRLESVQNAVDQAKWLAKFIAGKTSDGFKSVPWFWSDIGAMKLQIAGIHSGNTRTIHREEGEAFALYHLVDQTVVCVESLNSAKDHMLARKLIDQGTQVSEADIQQGPEALKALLAQGLN